MLYYFFSNKNPYAPVDAETGMTHSGKKVDSYKNFERRPLTWRREKYNPKELNVYSDCQNAISFEMLDACMFGLIRSTSIVSTLYSCSVILSRYPSSHQSTHVFATP
jgi:hypothetical protein